MLFGWSNSRTRKSNLKAIDSTITGLRLANCYKNAARSTDFNLNHQNFSTLPCIVPVRNSILHLDKASFSESIFKVVSTRSVRPGKRISNSDSPPSKPFSVSAVRTSKSISNRTFSAISVSICGSNRLV